MARSALRLEEEPMPWYDLPEEQLKDYRTGTQEPAELDRWWRERLDQARAVAREPVLTRYEAGTYGPVEVYDTEFSGAGGDRIRAWYLRPAGGPDPSAPVAVKFIGYGGGRGRPSEHALLPALGYALLVMDTRGQGGRWSTGATGDHADGWHAGPEYAAVMTRGIARPEDYYYTRLFTDAVRAVETACALAGAARVAVTGVSQGGGLSLLRPGRLTPSAPEFHEVRSSRPGILINAENRPLISPFAEHPLSEMIERPSPLPTFAWLCPTSGF